MQESIHSHPRNMWSWKNKLKRHSINIFKVVHHKIFAMKMIGKGSVRGGYQLQGVRGRGRSSIGYH